MKVSVRDKKSFRDTFMGSLSILKNPSCYNGEINIMKFIFIEQMILGLCHLFLTPDVEGPQGNNFYLGSEGKFQDIQMIGFSVFVVLM